MADDQVRGLYGRPQTCRLRTRGSIVRRAKWVTFSCTGDPHQQVQCVAHVRLGAAGIRHGAGTYACGWTTRKKHNGHCFVSRIDVMAGD